MYGHYICSYDGSFFSNYVKILNVCGIFRVLLNSLFDHLIEVNEQISCKHANMELRPKIIITRDKICTVLLLVYVQKLLKECNSLL